MSFRDIGDERIALTPLWGGEDRGGVDVSTANLPRTGYETCIFGGTYDNKVTRYSTLDEAKQGHEEWVSRLLKEATR